jgi:diguanylate cyclase (GGDEF)-like protein
MNLRKQILFSVLGITVLAQVVFSLLAYQQITESRGDQLTIFLQYLTREIAERIMLPGDRYVTEIYLEELRQKFSTPHSTLIVQKDNRILYIAGNPGQDNETISYHLNEAYADLDKHGLIEMDNIQYYWALSQLPNKEYQLVMLEPAGNEEIEIASTLRLRLLSSGFIILWIAVWISLVLSSKISRQLDEKNDQLEHMALHDNLTGLPNRTLFNDRLKQVLLQSERSHKTFALFLIDLDRFKEINDTLGHHFGDELLKIVSSRLLSAIRENDSIARLGGDEFAVLLPQTDLQGAELCAKRIIQAMEAPFCINDVATESKASIGISMYPEHGDNTNTLVQYADVAMYQAKKLHSGYAVYDPAQNTHSIRRLQLMNDLRYAIDNNEIKNHYQPLVNLKKNLTTNVEALARWQHPALGNISPVEFIPMAEQMGLIRKLTLQLLERALQDSVDWKEQGYDPVLNINLSVFCLQDLSLPEEINAALKTYSVDASNVELEITESGLMQNLSRARKILDKLNLMGLHLAIDDFGTGFSSLNYLKNLPVDTLKIDKSFVSDMCANTTDMAVIKTIIELAHNLNCQVVAEGVEDQPTLDGLRSLSVDIIQGYYFSKPMPPGEMIAWLDNFNN